MDRLKIQDKVIQRVFAELRQAQTAWRDTLKKSFLPDTQKSLYLDLLNDRCTRLALG